MEVGISGISLVVVGPLGGVGLLVPRGGGGRRAGVVGLRIVGSLEVRLGVGVGRVGLLREVFVRVRRRGVTRMAGGVVGSLLWRRLRRVTIVGGGGRVERFVVVASSSRRGDLVSEVEFLGSVEERSKV